MNTTANTTPATLLNLNDMIEQTLDTIPDAPDYSNPPAGEYNLLVKDVKVETYQVKEKTKDGVVTPAYEAQRLKITYSVNETKSTAAGEIPVPDGTMFTETFQGTEQGLSFFKSRIKTVMNASDLAGVSLGDMMNSIKGTSFDARISIKKSPKPNSTTEFYENIQIKVIPASA